jgi:signal transduction histidine kinase
LSKVLSLVRASTGAIYLVDTSGNVLLREISANNPTTSCEMPARIPLGRGPLGAAALEGRVVCSGQDEGAGPGGAGAVSRGPVVSVPLTSKGKVLGVMSLLADGAEGLPQDEIDVLEAVGGQIGVAIENAQLFNQVQRLAVLEERERLAREMHDGLAQIIGYLHLRIRAAEDMLQHGALDDVRAELHQSAAVAQDAYAEVREAILGLRTSVGPEKDFLATLGEYLKKFQHQSSIPITLELQSDRPVTMAPAAELQLIRIVQEALTNVRKHAAASQAWVRIEAEADCAVITIGDNGRGFDVSQPKAGEGNYGLQTMRERAESVSGALTVASAPGQGTRIIVRLPMATEGGQAYGTDANALGGRSRAVSEGSSQPSRP